MNLTKRAFMVLVILSFPVTSQARDWYFDKDSIGGKCSDTGPGTITQPFCNVFNKLWNQSWNNPQAGDTIYIRQGVYGGRQFWIKSGVLNNGTPGNPITIKAYPGETVIFDALTAPVSQDRLINLYGYTHDLSFVGPFEAKNYNAIMDGDWPPIQRKNLSFDNWTVHDVSYAFLFRKTDGCIVRNSYFYDIKGAPGQSLQDNVLCVSARGQADMHSTNVLIENCTAHDVNDGRGNDDGDAGAFHTDHFTDVATFRNLVSYRNSEDGVDTKAQIVIMENIISHHNGATGIKLWGGNQGRISTYNLKNILTYGNSETGLKCSGNGDSVTATIDHLTSWSNGEDSVKNTVGIDTSSTCDLTIRNSIIGEAGLTAVLFPVPRTGYSSHLDLINTDINHNGVHPTIQPLACPKLSGKYTTLQYTNGTFNTDMTTGVNCEAPYGTMSGSAVNPMSFSPGFVDAQPLFTWWGVTTGAVTSNTLTYWIQAQYPWPDPAIGSYVEINDDGIRRQITAKGDVGNPTIRFAPPVSSPVCGRVTDCFGVRVVGWNTSTTHTNDFSLTTGSPAIGKGVWVSGVHCPVADDNGGSELTGCVHWRGAAPDLGFKKFQFLQPSSLPEPQIKKARPY